MIASTGRRKLRSRSRQSAGGPSRHQSNDVSFTCRRRRAFTVPRRMQSGCKRWFTGSKQSLSPRYRRLRCAMCSGQRPSYRRVWRPRPLERFPEGMLSRIAGFGEFQQGRFSDRSQPIPQSVRLIRCPKRVAWPARLEGRLALSRSPTSLGAFPVPWGGGA